MGNLTKKKTIIISCIIIVLVSAVILHFAFKTKENPIDNNTEPEESNDAKTVTTVEKLLNTNEYITAEMPDDGTRYIKTINGIQTNDWVDIYPGGGIFYSSNRVDKKKCLEFIESERKRNVKQNWELTDVTEGKKIRNSHEAYYSIKGEIMHIIVINISGSSKFFDYETGREIPVEVIYG